MTLGFDTRVHDGCNRDKASLSVIATEKDKWAEKIWVRVVAVGRAVNPDRAIAV
jgi:hypothetical protein